MKRMYQCFTAFVEGPLGEDFTVGMLITKSAYHELQPYYRQNFKEVMVDENNKVVRIIESKHSPIPALVAKERMDDRINRILFFAHARLNPEEATF